MPTFLHSADWQIGKPYARVTDPYKRARLRRARVEAIARIGEHLHPAEGCPGAEFLLVAGGLFDSPTPAESDVSAACAAIGHLEVPVLSIGVPGNHDHGAPGGLDPLGTGVSVKASLHGSLDVSVDTDEENPACDGNRLQIKADWMKEVDYVAPGWPCRQ